MYSLVLTTVVALAAAAPTEHQKRSLSPLPAGSPDGIYLSTVNSDGTKTWEFQSPINTTHTANLVARDYTGVHCNNYYIGGDAETAAQQLTNLCGGGYSFSRSIAIQAGNAVAYGCDYGNGQTCHASDVGAFYGSLFNQCGAGAAGWWNQDSWKASYGVASAGSSFC